jgi:excisionase family DNA binding protein
MASNDVGLSTARVETETDPEAARAERATRLALSVEETAALLGISKWLAYELVAQGKLPALRLGRRLVVPRVALERMLEQVGPITGERLSRGGVVGTVQ